MKRFYRSFLLFSSLLAFSQLGADTVESSDDLSDDEVRSIREWISTKRQVTVNEIGGNLSISGEISSQFEAINERVNGVRQRGPGGATKKGSKEYEISLKLIFDYRTDNTWTNGTLKFKNKAGLFGGTSDKIKLEKAYWGARAYQEDAIALDIEIGRKPFDTIYDSKVQFGALFDGVIARLNYGFEKAGTFYAVPSLFIVDQRKDHIGFATELGLLEILGTGFYTKYSLIDWDTRHNYNKVVVRQFEFIISQAILGYQFVSKKFDKLVRFYIAGLYNHRAKAREITDYRREAWGSYLGFSIGTARKKGDWAFAASYQALAAQAVPSFDVNGIGIGNAADRGFYYNDVKDVPVRTTRKTASGNANWHGFGLNFVYLLTSNLAIKQEYKQSTTLQDRIGPYRRFREYELRFVYAF
jgi:hypothetical protein